MKQIISFSVVSLGAWRGFSLFSVLFSVDAGSVKEEKQFEMIRFQRDSILQVKLKSALLLEVF